MSFAGFFNYFEAGLWLVIALTVFIRRIKTHAELEKLAFILSFSFILFSISDVIEASTGAWWRPCWLFGLKALCVLSFACCWIKYAQINKRLRAKLAKT